MVSKDKPDKKVGGTPQGGDTMAKREEPKAIMVKPLPQILDEIEASIGLADEAAENARNAAEEARKAGEKAANEAARVAAQAIAKVEKVAKETSQLAELLKATLLETSDLLEKKLSGK